MFTIFIDLRPFHHKSESKESVVHEDADQINKIQCGRAAPINM